MKVQTIKVYDQVIPAGLLIGGFLKRASSLYVPQVDSAWPYGQATNVKAIVLRGINTTVTCFGEGLHDPTVDNLQMQPDYKSLDESRGVVIVPFRFSGDLEIWTATSAPEDPGIIWDQDAVKSAFESGSVDFLAWRQWHVVMGCQAMNAAPSLAALDQRNLERLGFIWHGSGLRVMMPPQYLSVSSANGAKSVRLPFYELGSGAWECDLNSTWNRAAAIAKFSRDIGEWASNMGSYVIAENVYAGGFSSILHQLASLSSAGKLQEGEVTLDLIEWTGPSYGGASAHMGYIQLLGHMQADEIGIAARAAILRRFDPINPPTIDYWGSDALKLYDEFLPYAADERAGFFARTMSAGRLCQDHAPFWYAMTAQASSSFDLAATLPLLTFDQDDESINIELRDSTYGAGDDVKAVLFAPQAQWIPALYSYELFPINLLA